MSAEIKAAVAARDAEWRAKVEAERDAALSEIDWSPGRWDYGDNAAHEQIARRLTDLLDSMGGK